MSMQLDVAILQLENITYFRDVYLFISLRHIQRL